MSITLAIGKTSRLNVGSVQGAIRHSGVLAGSSGPSLVDLMTLTLRTGYGKIVYTNSLPDRSGTANPFSYEFVISQAVTSRWFVAQFANCGTCQYEPGAAYEVTVRRGLTGAIETISTGPVRLTDSLPCPDCREGDKGPEPQPPEDDSPPPPSPPGPPRPDPYGPRTPGDELPPEPKPPTEPPCLPPPLEFPKNPPVPTPCSN